MQALILAFALEQNYHVMRLTHDAGYTVHVLGKDCAEGLKFSRFCTSFKSFAFDPRAQTLDVALKIVSNYVKEKSIDVILPSDVVSTRLLSALTGRLPVPTYPLPTPATFDAMNNKWQFFNFCRQHDIPVPDTWLFDDVAALKQALAKGEVDTPIILKPLSAMSQRGIIPILNSSNLDELDKVDYKPVLVQRLIDGALIDISVLGNHGKITAAAVQKNTSSGYVFVRYDELYEIAEKLVKVSKYHGIAHLDAIQDKQAGKIYFLECNPRFWFSIFAAANGGLNFVEEGLKLDSVDVGKLKILTDVDVPSSRIAFKKLLKLQKLNFADRNTLTYFCADPVGRLAAKLPAYDDDLSNRAGSLDDQVACLEAIEKLSSN